MRCIIIVLCIFLYLSNASPDVSIKEAMIVYGKTGLKEDFTCDLRASIATQSSEVVSLVSKFVTIVKVVNINVMETLDVVVTDNFRYFLSLNNSYSSLDRNTFIWFIQYLNSKNLLKYNGFIVDETISDGVEDNICLKGRILDEKNNLVSNYRMKMVRNTENELKISHFSEYRIPIIE